MKKYLMAACILLLVSLPNNFAVAQHNQMMQQHSAEQMDGMGGGMMMMHDMMGAMMNDPIRRSSLLIHMIPTMKASLALTDDQQVELEAAVTTYESALHDLEQKARNAETELQGLWQSEDADPSAVKAALQAVAEHRVDMKALTFETGVKMRSLLSAHQRSTLDELNPAQLHQYMMNNMTMMEVMQAMHDGSMMQGGMMQSGMQGSMMQGSMMQGSMMQGSMMQGSMVQRSLVQNAKRRYKHR